MFLVDDNELTSVCLPGGMVAWLTPHEFKVAKAHACNGRTLADAVVAIHESEAAYATDVERRYRVVRMAVSGEFGAIARMFTIWGVEPTQ